MVPMKMNRARPAAILAPLNEAMFNLTIVASSVTNTTTKTPVLTVPSNNMAGTVKA